MATHSKPPVTKTAIKEAEALWSNFVRYGKWVIASTCVVLIIMAIVFIDW